MWDGFSAPGHDFVFWNRWFYQSDCVPDIPILMLTYEAPILFVCFIFLQWFPIESAQNGNYATQDLV